MSSIMFPAAVADHVRESGKSSIPDRIGIFMTEINRAQKGLEMKENYRLLIINPGSTSTKVSLYDNEA
ncbi:MAG: hypothetical protein IJL72_11035, partial [Lachnospiraceae bacterium]|nr:hypothetical protein [Lachnospiraceae bacterium]